MFHLKQIQILPHLLVRHHLVICLASLQDTARQLSSATCSRGEKVSLIADLLAGIFYVLAGAFGGYATHLSLIRFGNVCWLIGSVISGVRPCLALRTDCARPVAADVELGAAGAGDHA